MTEQPVSKPGHPPRLSDTEAMDAIHRVMSGVMWSPDTLDDICELVHATGRTIAPPDDGECVHCDSEPCRCAEAVAP